MNYDFGSARELYAEDLRPRILFGPDDVPRLRALVRRGRGKAVMTAIRERVRPHVEWTLACSDLGAAFTDRDIPRGGPAYGALGAARDMALVALVDEDADSQEALLRLLGNEDWIEFRARKILPDPIAYDIAYDLLPEAARAAYRHQLLADTRRRIGDIDGRYFRMPAHNITLGAGVGSIWGLLAVLGERGVGELAAETTAVLRAFDATMHTVYGEDGYPEEDMGYGTGVGAHMSQIAEALRRAGLYDPYTQCPRYARFGRAVLHFVQPWGQHLSTTGDHGDDMGQREFVLPRLAAATDDPTLMWLAETLSYSNEVSVGKDRQLPGSLLTLLATADAPKAVHPRRADVPTAFCDRARGLVSFRSGWREDDALVVFDGSQRSPAGQGHAHASCGHVSLSAFGEYFGIDTGRYNMEQNCHSVVLVNGESGRSSDGDWVYMKHDGRLIDYAPAPFVDYAAVDASHQYNTYWARRHLGLVKGRGAAPYVWLVDDINHANDLATYWWQLHTCPENTIRTFKASATVRGWRHGNLLDVRWLLPRNEAYPDAHTLEEVSQDEVTPSSWKYVANPRERTCERGGRPAAQVHYSRFAGPRLLAKIRGWNGRFMSLLLPREKGDKAAKVSQLATIPGALAVRIAFADVEDVVIFAFEHSLLEAADIVARGHWCVVRRSRKNGRVLAQALADGGTLLQVAGKQLI
jgi:hypothetical protein